MLSSVTARDRILAAARRLVLERGFSATAVDTILAEASTSKGAFFHHFPSKAHLGQALVEQYASQDAELLETFIARAEAATGDPAGQLIQFVKSFEELAAEPGASPPGCLFVSFIYERGLADERTDEMVRASITHWRERILDKLERAAAGGAMPPVDLPSLADHVFTTMEGALLLARALDEPGHVAAQLAHLRHYLELLFGRPVSP